MVLGALGSMLLLASMPAGADTPNGRQVGRWCRANPGSADALRCTDYIFAVANHVDATRRQAGLPQCVPANVDPEQLRRVMGRAFATNPEGNVSRPASFVGWVLLETFDCTSDRRGRGTPHRLPGPLMPGGF